MFGAIVAALLAAGAGQAVSEATIQRLKRGDVPGLTLADVRKYPPSVQDELVAYDAEDELCRGSLGPSTDAACARRNQVAKEIERKGWCFGPDSAVEAGKTWMRTGPKCRN